jgi:hypothetical protein
MLAFCFVSQLVFILDDDDDDIHCLLIRTIKRQSLAHCRKGEIRPRTRLGRKRRPLGSQGNSQLGRA